MQSRCNQALSALARYWQVAQATDKNIFHAAPMYKKRPPRCRGGLFENNEVLALFLPAAKQRTYHPDRTDTANPDERRERGHLWHWDGNASDVINSAPSVYAGAAGSVAAEIAGAELVGVRVDTERTETRWSNDRFASVGERNVEERSTVNRHHIGRGHADECGCVGPACWSRHDGWGDAAEVVNCEVITSHYHLIDGHVCGVTPSEFAAAGRNARKGWDDVSIRSESQSAC